MTPESIKSARIAAGLTQAKSASMLHVSIRTFIRWETGDTRMPGASWELFLLRMPGASWAIYNEAQKNPLSDHTTG